METAWYHTGVVSEQRTVAATRDQPGGHVPLVEQVKLDKLVAADHFKVVIPIAAPLQFIGGCGCQREHAIRSDGDI